MNLTRHLLFKVLTVVAATVTAFQPTKQVLLSSTFHGYRINESRPRFMGISQEERASAFRLQASNYNALPGRGGSLLLARSANRLHKDVLIVGGGLAGLSVALHLSQIDPTRQITILDRSDMLESPTGSFAAAGMLAPQSERLPKGNYLDLCLASKRMFPEFCQHVERMAREAGEEGAKYLVDDKEHAEDHGLEPWNIGYVASGGFLAPAFAGDTVATWAPPEDSKGTSTWLDATQARELEPNLHPDVVGGWWFPEDASVDARRLACSLKAACIGAGVQFLCGKNYAVSSLDLEEGNCNGLWLKSGKYISANSVLVANGAWMRTLLPVPIEPHKGQSLSLRMPKDRPPILRRVLFASDSYIVPKADGRIVIGATVEAGSFDGKVTPAGLMHILSYATELVPGLADLPIEETWAGLRPTTPDKGPILGETPWKNLYLAGGYWRNGVLLAPKTGELVASLIAGLPLSEEDQTYLKAFSWDRFTSPEGGAEMAANARYAASMYPIHSRKSGVGVAASVGTELGSYSTAVTAGEERRKDRESMWGDDDDAFELAAKMGQQDGAVFSFGDDAGPAHPAQPEKEPMVAPEEVSSSEPTVDDDTKLPHFLERNPEDPVPSEAPASPSATTVPYDGSPDALTVGYVATSTSSDDELEDVYKTIRENKSKLNVEMEANEKDERPDPGFRIYHVDKVTGEQREIPPFTPPGEFLESIKSPDGLTSTPAVESASTFDGYQRIQEAAAGDNDIQETMRRARMQNRVENDVASTPAGPRPSTDVGSSRPTSNSAASNLENVYEQIRAKKAATPQELNESASAERADPGFRIYHVDPVTQEEREVPPYTPPGAFIESIKNEYSKVEISSESGALQLSTGEPPKTNGATKSSEYSEVTYDGYQDILSANSADSRDTELDAMREARRRNRLGGTPVNEDDLDLPSP